jgi:hypothetical protein
VNLNFSDKAEVNRRLRATLVKHWIDLGRISFHVSINGVVAINGALIKLAGSGELSPQNVAEMIGEIESIQHVTRVEAEFDNWMRSGFAGLWRPLEEAGRKQTTTTASDGGPGRVINIKLKDDAEPL